MIETTRLLIREFAEADAEGLYEYLSLPETYRFEPGAPISLEEARALAKERSNGASFFAVALKGEDTIIGHLYFGRIEPAEFMTWELGYIFNPRYHNNGYCSEAAQALIGYGFRSLRAHRIIAHCNPLNYASWRVLEKIGMEREGHFKKKAFFRRDADNNPLWHDCYAYGILE
jgi:RimJ/RimL family protein N-acetyltransferase